MNPGERGRRTCAGLCRVDATHPLLDSHVDRFNRGVRTGDFGPMVEHLTEDATMRFEGVPAGPFEGAAAIAAAYRAQPPDDEIVVLGWRTDPAGTVIADYAWASAPAARAGELRLTFRGDRIAELVVTFG